jgi:hypothetical protein
MKHLWVQCSGDGYDHFKTVEDFINGKRPPLSLQELSLQELLRKRRESLIKACDAVVFASTSNYDSALETARRYENYVHFLEVAIEQGARLAAESAEDKS